MKTKRKLLLSTIGLSTCILTPLAITSCSQTITIEDNRINFINLNRYQATGSNYLFRGEITEKYNPFYKQSVNKVKSLLGIYNDGLSSIHYQTLDKLIFGVEFKNFVSDKFNNLTLNYSDINTQAICVEGVVNTIGVSQIYAGNIISFTVSINPLSPYSWSDYSRSTIQFIITL